MRGKETINKKRSISLILAIVFSLSILSLSITANDVEQTIDSFVEQSGITVGKDTQISVKSYNQYDSVTDTMTIPAELNYRADKTDRSSGWLTVYPELTTTVVAQAYYSGSTSNYMLLYGVIAFWHQSGTDYITSLNVQFQTEGCLLNINTGAVSPYPMNPPYCAEIAVSNPYANICPR